MVSKRVDSASEADVQGRWTHKAAWVNLWAALGGAAVTGLLAAAAAYMTKPGPPEIPPPSPPAGTPIRFDPVDRPVGLCNVFNGTGDWDPATAGLLVFNRPWNEQTKTGTGDYFLDGPAAKTPEGTWKGPIQQIGRDTKAGFAVELSAVVVTRPMADYLAGVTGPEGRYWTARQLPPHAAAATMVVTRDGTSKVEC
jgi:hypothetical protein